MKSLRNRRTWSLTKVKPKTTGNWTSSSTSLIMSGLTLKESNGPQHKIIMENSMGWLQMVSMMLEVEWWCYERSLDWSVEKMCGVIKRDKSESSRWWAVKWIHCIQWLPRRDWYQPTCCLGRVDSTALELTLDSSSHLQDDLVPSPNDCMRCL